MGCYKLHKEEIYTTLKVVYVADFKGVAEEQETKSNVRYIGVDAYAYNNPLKYTDPSGNIAVVDAWLVGFVHGFFSTSSNRGSAGWNAANHRAGNDIQIWGGLGAVDKHKTTLGQIWQVTSRLTWELPQTVFGLVSALFANEFGNTESVTHYAGATVLKQKGSFGGFTLGSYIIGDRTIEAKETNDLFQHEYGHYLQSQILGLSYLFVAAAPSLWSATTHDYNDHNHFWTERWANRLAYKHWKKHDANYDTDPNNPDWNHTSNPLFK
jgi:hypothetical protein